MATIDLGKIKQVWRGTYNNSTAYVVDDLVEYTDNNITSSYICVANSTGNAPSTGGTAHASWNFVAKGVADPIPSQSGNSGKFLKTNGSALSFSAAGGLVQAKQWIKQSTLLNDSNTSSVMGSPFDGTARLTLLLLLTLLKLLTLLLLTILKHGDQGFTDYNIHQMQVILTMVLLVDHVKVILKEIMVVET